MGKWLIGLGQEKYNVKREHLVAPESKEVLNNRKLGKEFMETALHNFSVNLKVF